MINRVKAALSGRQAAMLEILERLVLQNSFTENIEGGRAVSKMLFAELASIEGISVRTEPSPRFAPHIIAVSHAAESVPTGGIAIIGHLDTVFPPNTFEGFRVEGDIARGPGVLDMKGGLVVAIEALRALSSEGVLEKLPIRFVIVSDEEVGSPEGRPLIEREVHGSAAALVLEAGRKEDLVITARKGTAGLKAIAKGTAAHAGAAHASGANAIWALAKLIDQAQALTNYERGVTVNVGKVSGGHSKNTVPDAAEALLDFRFERMEDGRATLAALHAAAEEAAAAVPGTSVIIEGTIAREPLERTDANVALYREYAACAKCAGLGDGEAPLIGGGSDASTTATMGIPSIDGLGPRGSGFHTKEELIEVATLVPKAEALARFLLGRARAFAVTNSSA
jgi:glutamate carboxypeptidase